MPVTSFRVLSQGDDGGDAALVLALRDGARDAHDGDRLHGAAPL